MALVSRFARSLTLGGAAGVRMLSSGLYFTKSHEWVAVDDNGVGTVGITNYAQEQLGDIVHVQLPEVGETAVQQEAIASVESVKAASEVYSPVNGEVVEVNTKLADAAELVNQSPEADGWFIKVQLGDNAEDEQYIGKEEYDRYVAEECD